MWKVPLSAIDFDEREEQAVLDVIRSKWVSMGPRTVEFEKRIAEFIGCRHAVAVSSGTAALHLALVAADVGPGDEVIVSGLTFIASINAVLYCGATPVLADIRSDTDLTVDPEDVRGKLSSRTKAILPVHYAGYPCDMDAISGIARDRDLAVLEDAAHAIGSEYGGRAIGTIGDATCFSFFANKNMVTGEGGLVTTDSDELADAIRSMRSHGMTALSYDKERGHAFSYDVLRLGFNYRPTEITAAIGMVQLEKLASNNAKRRRATEWYREGLADIDGVTVPFRGRLEESACHLMPVLLPADGRREAIMSRMRDQGIQTSIHYPFLPEMTVFRGVELSAVPRVARAARSILTLPMHPFLTHEDVDTVCATLRSAIQRA